MKNMKKLCALLLSLLLIASLAACGGSSEPDDENCGKYTADHAYMIDSTLGKISIPASKVLSSDLDFTLNAKGKFIVTMDGKDYKGKWSRDGETFTANAGGQDFAGTIGNGVIEIEDSEVFIVFVRK